MNSLHNNFIFWLKNQYYGKSEFWSLNSFLSCCQCRMTIVQIFELQFVFFVTSREITAASCRIRLHALHSTTTAMLASKNTFISKLWISLGLKLLLSTRFRTAENSLLLVLKTFSFQEQSPLNSYPQRHHWFELQPDSTRRAGTWSRAFAKTSLLCFLARMSCTTVSVLYCSFVADFEKQQWAQMQRCFRKYSLHSPIFLLNSKEKLQLRNPQALLSSLAGVISLQLHQEVVPGRYVGNDINESFLHPLYLIHRIVFIYNSGILVSQSLQAH